MKFFISLFFILATTLSFAQDNADRLGRIRNLTRFAFGSCNKQYASQNLWMDMLYQKPQLFLWGGDNVYINSKDPEDIKAGYAQQNSISRYRLFKSIVPIIGTWDDHDYGVNDGDGHFVSKMKSQELALDFFEEPLLSERRFQKGIYTSYEFGDPGKKVKMILLDVRYHKNLESEAPMLGKKQWRWLEEELRKSDASLHFIVSGTSILSPQLMGSEEWSDYEGELKRLLNLIKNTAAKGVVFLTGDKHFSSIFSRLGHLEFMSSGMTHNTRLPLRPVIKRMFPSPLFERNYGVVDIEWKENDPVITLHNRTDQGAVRNLKKFQWIGHSWNLQPVLEMAAN